MSLNALYVDFNSYFASVEQQLRPELRGCPIGVLPVMAETTCCIAASYEAKAFGVKTGTMVRDARKLCPDIILVGARPAIYIDFHHRLVDVVESCTPVGKILSIDEMVCRLTGSQQSRDHALALAAQIKQSISKKVGSEIRCSIGIAPNTFLAKLASNMQKPDGCVVIEQHELPDRLYSLELRDLTGIGRRMEQRLTAKSITTIRSLYALNRQQMRAAWGSVEGEYIYDKLRGLEPPESGHGRSSLGHSHVLPPEMRNREAALSVLNRLLQKACARLRSYQLYASMIHIRVKFPRRPTWEADGACSPTDDTLQLIHALQGLWRQYPDHTDTPYAVGISLSGLVGARGLSMDLFDYSVRQSNVRLDQTLDALNIRFGKNAVYFGAAHNALHHAPMRIAFNHIPDPTTEGDTLRPP
ncbi:MAG TPA: DNA polymerase [Methylophilaceae bacterium]|nr:DNA polymerase [Methylophilaceae bacterium]